jgi:hypothetical protein
MSSQKTTQKTVKTATKDAKRLMINTTDFDINNWSNTEIDFEDEKSKDAFQFTCYGRYNYGKESSPVMNQLVFKTGPIKLVTYGIPQLGQYAKTDKERSYIKVPLDPTQDSCVNLFKMFEKLDEWAVKNKSKFFTGRLAKFAKVYDYSSIVRKPQEVPSLDDDEDDDEDKPKKSKKSADEKPQYAKIKISTEYSSGDVDTVVYLREEDGPVKQEVKTITDIANLVTWQSTVQMICVCNKLWFGKSADKTGRRQFGIGFKLRQCEVIEKVSGSAKSDFTSYAFDDTIKVEEKVEVDEEDEKPTKPASKKLTGKKPAESDSESEDEKPTAKKPVDSDSESEDEKPAAKKPVDSDSESEDEKPAKPVGKKPAKSESDSESEDEKPAKPPAKTPAKTPAKKTK